MFVYMTMRAPSMLRRACVEGPRTTVSQPDLRRVGKLMAGRLMRRRTFGLHLAASPGLWFGGACAQASDLTETDAAFAIRIALERGAVAAVNMLGRTDGFLANPKVRIALPGYLNDASKLLNAIGQRQRVDDLVTAMNRAAEAAVPKARTLLIVAVKSMSVDDARRVITGGENSVTSFFADKTRTSLGTEFLPIVTQATEKVALADKYNKVAAMAAGLGLMDKQDANIQQYVTGKALDGLYLMIGEEERKIRNNPVATGSAILKKVFGSIR
jgi:Protein of unknown function (DUF4197)